MMPYNACERLLAVVDAPTSLVCGAVAVPSETPPMTVRYEDKITGTSSNNNGLHSNYNELASASPAHSQTQRFDVGKKKE